MNNFKDSMLFPMITEALNGPYMMSSLPKSSGKPNVRHQKTCPVCKREMVNLYLEKGEWKCKKCWDKENDR